MIKPRVFVLCPDYSPPSGGIRKLYRFVDVLNRHGITAQILHFRSPFRLEWFDYTTPVGYLESTLLAPSDFLVVPEVFGPQITKFGPGVRKIIYNQNSYLTFAGYSLSPGGFADPYSSAEVIAALTVSDDNRQYLQFAFPHLALYRLHYGIDTALFKPSPRKKDQIALMPRKNGADVVQVVNILTQRGVFQGYELLLIDGRPEREVAQLLSSCRFFFSFGHPEGCPLPPLEAMACGCVVIGYHGQGGREYFRPEFCYPIELGNIVQFARTAEQAMHQCKADASPFDEMGMKAVQYVHSHYSEVQEEQDILAFWREILNGPGRASGIY